MNTDNTTPLFNADEARKATEEARNSLTADVLAKCQYEAKNKQDKCEYWTGVSNEQSEKVKTTAVELLELGYTVDVIYSTANSEWKLKISW